MQAFLVHGYFIALSISHRLLSHSTLIKPSNVLSDATEHITTRVHPQGSHSFNRREEDDFPRRVTIQCDTWQHNLPNVREVLGTVESTIRATFSPIENYRTFERFLESNDI